MNRYYEQSQKAEARANASTSDPYNLVNQSATLRTETEDLMNQTKEEFSQRQDEFSAKLDNLAGQLETLDLSELSKKVKQSRTDITFQKFFAWANKHICDHPEHKQLHRNTLAIAHNTLAS